MRKFMFALLLAVLLGAVASQAAITYPIGQASTIGFSNGAFAGQTPRGWDFMINQPITVYELGVNAGDSIPITLTLWDVTTQTILAQTVENSTAFAWEFATLTTPVNLLPGDIYSVIGWADTTGTGVPWYIFNNTPPAAFNPTGTVTYLNTRFDNNIGPNVFPLGTLASPAQYGVTDIGYTPAIPEPGTFLLLGSGILGLASVLRHKLNL